MFSFLPEVVACLHEAIRDVLGSSTYREGLAKLSLGSAESPLSEFAELIAADTQRWAEIVKTSGFKLID